jgi:hypothetical protein
MTDMIERVAMAMYHSTGVEFGLASEWGDHGAEAKDEWRHIARAAIAAMRDCTPEMLDAGSAAHPAGGYRRETLLNDIIECEWVAMVDAALECSTKPDEK